MKITKLRIKNLNSLKEEHCINFNQTPLSETGLFAITGPTGAGKSTLLDAISLALYNQIPRSGRISTANIKNFGTLITRGTLDCFAEVEYQVNKNNYRSKWSISRNRNHNLRDYEMELSQLNQEGEWDILEHTRKNIPAKNAEITGLNYDQFIKSIVLSQGEFARFLKSNASDRSELLEKITGTEIYRQIGKAAYAKWKEQESIIVDINNKMQGIDLLTSEEKEQITADREKLKSELEKLQQQIKITHEQIEIRNQDLHYKSLLVNNTTEKENFLKEQKNFASEEEQLEQHNKLIHIKGDLQQNINLAEQIKKLEKQLELWKIQIKTKKKEFEQIKKQLSLDIEYEEQISKERKVLLPILSKVSLLDDQIKNLTAQYQEQKKELEESNIANKKLELKKAEDSKELQNCEKSKLEVEKYLLKNKAIEEVPAILPLLNQQIELMKDNFFKLEEEVRILKNQELKNYLLKGSNWKEKTVVIQKQIDDLKRQLIPIENDLKKASINTREELKHTTENTLSKGTIIKQLEASQKIYLKDNEESKKLCENLKDNNKLISLIQEFLKDQEPKLKVLQLKEEETILRIQRLELESSLKDKRDKLLPNEACPLCGSTHHPFVENYHNKSEESQKEREKISNVIKTLTADIDTKQKELIRLNTDNKNIQDRIEKLKITLAENLKDFEKEQEKIKTSLKITEQDALIKLIKEYQSEELYIKNLAVKFEEREGITQNLQLLKPILHKSTQIYEDQKQSEDYLSKFAQFIIGKKNLKSKLDELKTRYNHYQNKKEELSLLDKNIVKLTELLKADLKNLELSSKEIRQKSDKLNKLLNSKANLEKERKQLLGNKLPNEEQVRIDKKLEQASKQKQESVKNELSARKDIANLEEQLNKESINYKELLKNYELEFNRLLALVKERSFENLELAIAAILPEKKAEEIKNKKEAFQKKEAAIKQSKKDLEESIAKIKLKLTDIPLEELLEKEKQEDTKLSEDNKKLGAFDQQLKQDKENRKKAGNLLKELELQRKEVKRWDNLNDLIGDATGNKYSKFAQELSLQQMLSLANLHLRKLDKRYLLKYNPQQNEDLFVVDTLQGNEERSVRTLSGGESFIISLALALGLSDLAGQNTQLETLFIDEGFGSLDQVTLELALGTLERLQAESNRTIGIISHVEALKERISTQIELVKDNSGNSHIEIR